MKSTEKIEGHIPVLDGLRGFAVLYVMFAHLFPFDIIVWNTVVEKIIFGLFTMGWSGVDLFFVLSGFLITGILYQSKGNKHYYRNFYIRRTLRIFPLYYLLVFIFLIVVPHIPIFKQVNFFWITEGNKIWYWFYLTNFSNELRVPVHLFLCVAWSLSIEEQYYIVYPTIVSIIDRKKLIYVLLGIFVFSFVLRAVLFYLYKDAVHAYHFTFTRLDAIAFGGITRILLIRINDFGKAISFLYYSFKYWTVLLFAIIIYCALTIPTGIEICYHPLMVVLGYGVVAIFYSGLLLRSVINHKGLIFSFFNSKILRTTGKYSYAIYLLHFPTRYFILTSISVIAKKILVMDDSILNLPTSKIAVFIFSVIFTYLFAYLSWQLFEGPINRLKESFVLNN
ncbi:MAG TPA: acyltransferase [Cytophagaceae bacterium]|jgi:peptidoglycan/LPS O-acetylase OafA/YrhL|nr:acyltransferase [Cytophagaceae bacterium]